MDNKIKLRADEILAKLRARNPELGEQEIKKMAAKMLVKSISTESLLMNIPINALGFIPGLGYLGSAAYFLLNSELLKNESAKIDEAVRYLLGSGEGDLPSTEQTSQEAKHSRPLGFERKCAALKMPVLDAIRRGMKKYSKQPYLSPQKAGLSIATKGLLRKRLAAFVPLGIGVTGLILFDYLSIRKRGLNLIEELSRQEK